MRLDVDELDTCATITKSVNGLINGCLRNQRYASHKTYKKFESDEQACQNQPLKLME